MRRLENTPRRVAIDEQAHETGREVGVAASPGIGPLNLYEIQAFDSVGNVAC